MALSPSRSLPEIQQKSDDSGCALAESAIPLVDVVRGGLAESVHRGAFAIVDSSGMVIASAGNVEAPFFARSALKPLQLVAMLRAGLELPEELLALGAASHSGAQQHIDGARRILEQHGLDVSALRNVTDLPYGASERETYIRQGGVPSQLAQNCSGKHAAMVSTCTINGWSSENYLDPTHPLQRLIETTVDELTSERAADHTTDGCGTPLYSYSLRGVARAYARLGAAEAGTNEARVAAAMRAHPEMVAGEGRDVTALMRSVPGLLAKDGAEAVQLLALRRPESDHGAPGLGIAIKIADGSDRARAPITRRILTALGVSAEAIEKVETVPILGGGQQVGQLRVTEATENILGGLDCVYSSTSSNDKR